MRDTIITVLYMIPWQSMTACSLHLVLEIVNVIHLQDPQLWNFLLLVLYLAGLEVRDLDLLPFLNILSGV